MLADSAARKKALPATASALKANIRDASGVGKGRIRPPLCRAHPPTGTLIDTASFPALAGCVVLEDSPSQVYGAALLMRFGSDPIRSSNLRSSARGSSMFGGLAPTFPIPLADVSRGGDPPGPPRRAGAGFGWFWFFRPPSGDPTPSPRCRLRRRSGGAFAMAGGLFLARPGTDCVPGVPEDSRFWPWGTPGQYVLAMGATGTALLALCATGPVPFWPQAPQDHRTTGPQRQRALGAARPQRHGTHWALVPCRGGGACSHAPAGSLLLGVSGRICRGLLPLGCLPRIVRVGLSS
jgi:hypothetical protein